MRRFTLIACFVLVTPFLFALSTQVSDQNNDGRPDQWISTLDNNTTLVQKDLNGDGKVDYSLLLDADGKRIKEELDYNYDGVMDDFYYYDNDVLVRQEIDSNYDGKIDIWVTITGGIYIQKIERDTNFDGKPDYVKVYGEEKK